MPAALENLNPKIYEKSGNRLLTADETDESIYDEIDDREVFDLLRNVADPEYPLTLEELNVVTQQNITVNNQTNEVDITFTPTVPHCSMATLIGLSLRVQLLRALPTRFKVNISITPGTHASEHAVNKQLNDKERVAAALENPHLTQMLKNQGIYFLYKYNHTKDMVILYRNALALSAVQFRIIFSNSTKLY